jgi:hypothetical protein
MSDQQLFFSLFVAPFRFLMETVKMFVFFALCIVGTIFYPFYLLLNHQPVPVIYWIAALLTLMMVISIARSPLYTVFGGIGLAVTLALCIGNIPGFLEQVMVIYHPYRIYWLIFGFFLFGILKPRKRSKRPVAAPIPIKPLRRSRARRVYAEPQYLPPTID